MPYEVGRAGKASALALKTKLALFVNDWVTAVSASKAIIDMGKYKLEADYGKIFTIENENNGEVIFDIQGIADSDAEPGNTFEYMFSNVSSANGGWTWMCPSLWLVDKYEIIDKNPVYSIPDKRIPDAIYKYFEGRDPRMDANILRPGSYFLDKGNVNRLYPYEITSYTNSTTKMAMRKYVIPGDKGRDGVDASPLNFIIFRYADILLNYAEAKVQLEGVGDQSVYDALNSIRARASNKLPLYSMGQFSKEKLLETIYNERIRELPMEGWLYFDFKRWKWIELNVGFKVMGMDVTATKVSFSTKPASTRNFDPARDYLFPIPQKEINLNSNLTQNPNWQ